MINLFLGAVIGFLVASLWKTTRRRRPQQKETIQVAYVVKADNPDVGYQIEVGDVTDSEGNVLPDVQLTVEVSSSNAAALTVEYSDDPKAGTIHFGSPGQAEFLVNVKDNGGKILATGSASFTVTVGDPANVSGVSVKFDELTEV